MLFEFSEMWEKYDNAKSMTKLTTTVPTLKWCLANNLNSAINFLIIWQFPALFLLNFLLRLHKQANSALREYKCHSEFFLGFSSYIYPAVRNCATKICTHVWWCIGKNTAKINPWEENRRSRDPEGFAHRTIRTRTAETNGTERNSRAGRIIVNKIFARNKNHSSPSWYSYFNTIRPDRKRRAYDKKVAQALK